MRSGHGVTRSPGPAGLLAIGEVARRSGLSVSALRFYDGEGVLRPNAVDSSSGYRRYAPEQVRVARLVAGLRRIGMPLAEIRAAVEQAGDTELIGGLLDAHLARLEAGLADARREIGRVRALLQEDDDAGAVVADVGGGDLRRLVEAVRFAVGTDPEHPVLIGGLLELTPGAVRLVATDRYRLAAHHVEGNCVGSRSGVVPVSWLDEVSALTGARRVRIRLSSHDVHAVGGDRKAHAHLVDGDYPDYRRLVDAVEAPETPWERLLLAVGAPRPGLATIADTPGKVVVREEFLLDALRVAGEDAMLRLDGPIAPLAIRAGDGALTLLMPTRSDS